MVKFFFGITELKHLDSTVGQISRPKGNFSRVDGLFGWLFSWVLRLFLEREELNGEVIDIVAFSSRVFFEDKLAKLSKVFSYLGLLVNLSVINAKATGRCDASLLFPGDLRK